MQKEIKCGSVEVDLTPVENSDVQYYVCVCRCRAFLEKILLQLATLNHSSSKVARSIDLDLKKILPSSEF